MYKEIGKSEKKELLADLPQRGTLDMRHLRW
jgi:hypothetical protein